MASNATAAGYGPVYQTTHAAASTTDWATIGLLPAVAGRIYEIEGEFQRTAGTGGAVNLTVRALDAAYNTTGAVAQTVALTGAVQTGTFRVSDTASSGVLAWPAGTVWLRPYIRHNTSDVAGTFPHTLQSRRLSARDVTSVAAAAASAAAASTSASNASTSATNAGTSASAAQTSATNAGTSATNAAGSATAAGTSATQASNSATTAQGHASNASTSATAAAGSATAAGNSATAAAGSATNAGTSATNAGNSATAAAASAVSASSSFNAARLAAASTLPSDFSQDGLTWTASWSGDPTTRPMITAGGGYTFPTVAGIGKVAQIVTVVGGYIDTATIGVLAIQPGRRYRVTVVIRCLGPFSGTPGGYLFFIGCDASYTAVTTPGAALHPLVANTWKTVTYELSTAELLAFSSNATFLRAMVRPGSTSGGAADAVNTYQIRQILLEDVTESVSAANSATAANTSASTASTQAGLAGSSASAASGSATTASTQAGNAATSASAAATSAANASSSAASASTSAVIAASVGTNAINANARFTDYPTPTGYPAGWIAYGGTTTPTRQDSPYGGYALRMTVTSAISDAGAVIYGPATTLALDGYYVLEAEVQLVSGALDGAGLYVAGYNDALTAAPQAWQINFRNEVPIDRAAAPGAGVVGQRYRYSKLIKVSVANVTRPMVYAMQQWSGYGQAQTAKSLDWTKALIRPATPAEVSAGVALPALQASVAATQTVVASLQTNYALARYTLSATTPGGAAVLSLTSSTYGTIAGLSADQIYFGNNTIFDDATDTMRTTTGANVRVVAYGASFGTDGQLTEWEGPSSVAFAAMSRANAYFYRANVAPYAGGSALTPSTGAGGYATASGSAATGMIAGSGWQTFKTFTVTGVPASASISLTLTPGVSSTSGGAANAEWRLIQTTGGAVVAGPAAGVITNMGADDPINLGGTGTASGSVSYSVQARIVSGSNITNAPFQVDFSASQVI